MKNAAHNRISRLLPLEKFFARALVIAFFSGLASSSAASLPKMTLYVDCAAVSAGDGSPGTPFERLTSAMPAARSASATHNVTIQMAPGVCSSETLPIALDFPVRLHGSRSPLVDAAGLPTGEQESDTLITAFQPPGFFAVTGDDVRISRLSLDGQITNPGGRVTGTRAIEIIRAQDFEVEELRIVGVGSGVRTFASSGVIKDVYVGASSEGFVLIGGRIDSPATVLFTRNRVDEYVTGAIAVVGGSPGGGDLVVTVTDNDFATSRMNTGPSNPFGVRVNAIGVGAPAFDRVSVRAVIARNAIRGSNLYGIIVNGGTVLRSSGGVADNRPYAGALDLAFEDNVLEPGTTASALITFTNSRAVQLPCELDPANTIATCPRVMNGQYWKYLQDSLFDITHSGEFDAYLLDHPAEDPVDGRVLNNVLMLNGVEIPNGTFVVVP